MLSWGAQFASVGYLFLPMWTTIWQLFPPDVSAPFVSDLSYMHHRCRPHPRNPCLRNPCKSRLPTLRSKARFNGLLLGAVSETFSKLVSRHDNGF